MIVAGAATEAENGQLPFANPIPRKVLGRAVPSRRLKVAR